MKAVVAGIVALAVACSGCLGSNKYESAKETEAAVRAIQVSATQTEHQMTARAQRGISLGEYFKRTRAVAERLDSEISALEILSWKHKLSDRDIAIAFIEQCKVLLRSYQADIRLLIQQNSATLAYHEAKQELDEAKSPVARDVALEKFRRTNDDLLEILNEKLSSDKERLGK